MRYALAPYRGSGRADDPFRPHGTDAWADWGAIDLRPAQATHGYALVGIPEPTRLPSGVLDLGDDLSASSPTARRALGARLGVTLAGSLRAQIVALLTEHGTGPRRWKNIWPDHRGRWEIWLGGLVWRCLPISGGATVSSTIAGSENPLSESGVWSRPGVLVNQLKKVSGLLRPDTVPDNCMALYDTTANGGTDIGADQFCEATRAIASVTGKYCGVCVRMTASGANPACYMLRAETNSNFAMYYIDTGSNFNALGATYADVPGTTDVMRLEVSGTTLTPYINTVAKATRTDSNLASGQPGLFLYQDAEVDDITSFSAGDLSAAAAVTPKMTLLGVG